MPREAARIFLEITAVRAERLQEITTDDAHREGVNGRCLGASNGCYGTMSTWESDFSIEAFQTLWDSINAKRGFSWDANPWVRVYEFQKVNKTDVENIMGNSVGTKEQ